MKNFIYEKVYVISYVRNIGRRKQISELFNELNIDFEFIYGLDIYNFENIHHIKTASFYDDLNYQIHGISCALAHYTAIEHAYYENYNNCLICEDDLSINMKYIDLLKYYFTLSIKEADVIKYCHNKDTYLFIEKYDDYFDKIHWHSNAGCYGFLNRNAMEKYLNNQYNKLYMADNDNLFNGLSIYAMNIKNSLNIFKNYL